MADQLRQALQLRAKQERVARRLQVMRAIGDRYLAAGRAYQRELDSLIESMSSQDVAMYRVTLATERSQKK